MRKKKVLCLILLAVVLVAGIAGFVLYRNAQKPYCPETVTVGDNTFRLGAYRLQESGLSGLQEMLDRSEGLTHEYDVAYFQAEVDQNGRVAAFRLSLNTFDESGDYAGLAGYDYNGDTDTLSYTGLQAGTGGTVVYQPNANATIDYLNTQLRTIPLVEQIKVSGLKRYYVQYQPYTQIEEGTPIFDGRERAAFSVLAEDAYNAGEGGVSDGKTSVVFRLYDGTSIAMGQQYLYVCQPIDPDAAVGNQSSMMECDYYINNGVLKLTRDYGQSWIETDITAEELQETLTFHRSSFSLPPESIFLTVDVNMPIAYFYGGDPKLKILQPGADTWTTVTDFPTTEDYMREITHRVVGFVTPDFGYAALGTDWSMGAGESKAVWFTTDGGQTWTEKELPEVCTIKTLLDLYMATETVGVLALSEGVDGYLPRIYVTETGGDSWTVVALPYDTMPMEVQYLSRIERLEVADGQYTLVLGQGDSGTLKAVFVSDSLADGWIFQTTYRSTVHTVG